MSTVVLEESIHELAEAILQIEDAAGSHATVRHEVLEGADANAQSIIETAEYRNLAEIAAIVAEIKKVFDSLLRTHSSPDPIAPVVTSDLIERVYNILEFTSTEKPCASSLLEAARRRLKKKPVSSSPYSIVNPREFDDLSATEWFHRDTPLCTPEGTGNSGVAQRLLRMLKIEMPFVDRICITQRLGLSNELRILDCAEILPSQSISIRPGHRCFVSPNSSLFALGPDTCRIFGDSRRVISSFNERNRPAQRVLGTLERRGFRSGICLALVCDNQIVGFLFLNSRRIEAFSEQSWQMNGLLAAAQAVARSTVIRARSPKPSFVAELSPNFSFTAMGTVFQKADFQEALAKALPNFHVQVNYASLPFLYSPENVATAFVAALPILMPRGGDIAIDVERQGSVIHFSAKAGGDVSIITAENGSYGATLTRWLQSLGVIVCFDQGVSVSIPFDPAMGVLPWLPYSVYSGHASTLDAQT